VALVDEQYVYDADAAGTPAPTFSLDVARQGMNINSTTGVITWTPTNIFKGGKVVVRATNTGGSATQTFYIYVAGPPECDASTLAYWKFNETGLTSYKDSYGSHDAIAAANPPQDSAGIEGMAKKVPAVDNTGILVPDHSDFHWAPGESFSISFWFKNGILDRPSNSVIIGRDEGAGGNQWWIGFVDNGPADDDFTFFVYDTDYPPYNYRDAYITTATYLNDYNWHHIVCTYDASDGKLRIYYDGTLPASGGNPRDYKTSTTRFDYTKAADISVGFLPPTFPMDGTIDELLIFDKALNLTEVQSLYTKGSGGNPACDPGNSPPLFRTDPVASAREDSPYTYQFFANDVNASDVLTYSVTKKPAWLNVNLGTRTLSATPVNNNVGSDSVVIKVNDGKVDVYQRFLLTVINTNDAPDITSTPVATVNEEQPYSYDVEASDVDAGDHLVFSLRSPSPGWLSINASTGLITGTPPVDNTADFTVTVRVTDDSAAYDEQTYTLDILPINDAPIITGQQPLDVDEDNSLLIQLSDITYIDVDNGPGDMTLSVINGANYSVVTNTITPVLNYNGTLIVNIELSDLDSTTSGQINVTVNPVNDPPVIASLPEDTAWEGQSYSYVFNATDPELNPLTYSVPKKPAWLTWVSAIRTLSGTPSFTDIGKDTLTISVNDGTESTEATVVIEVLSANNIPYITSVPVGQVDEDAMYIYNITFEDEDIGDVVTLTCPVKPTWLTFNQGQKLLTGTPTNDQVGTEPSVVYTVKLKVSDGKQDSTQTFTVTVININDPPEILAQTASVGAYIGVPKTIELSNLNVQDVDNLLSELTLTVLPGTGYSIAGNDVTINATEDKIVGVNVRVTDPGDLLDEGVLNITVLDNTGIKDLIESNKLVDKVYPVPAGEYIRFIVNSTEDYYIELIDITGKSVFEKEFTRNDKLVEISTDNLPAGLYIYKINNKLYYQIGRFTISNR
jgi:hypothetical protein